MAITKTDNIIAVVARSASGPGWANTPLWVVVRDLDGKLREECLQPEEQGDDIRMLYGIAERVHIAMVSAVERLTKKIEKIKKIRSDNETLRCPVLSTEARSHEELDLTKSS